MQTYVKSIITTVSETIPSRRRDTKNGGNEAQVTTSQSWDFLGLSCCGMYNLASAFFSTVNLQLISQSTFCLWMELIIYIAP